ncbi:hypothetical protein KYB31_07930 [Clostridium felsineum]|uniref:hypothetical protein n=1 Tax=Clostridium felsineum TaxID=36839 RepID=UPI00214D9687|nr:hypothetical protein [Clostridium felsineum]MCR3758918.1 hypothetical protein [Clostridium felsineum]
MKISEYLEDVRDKNSYVDILIGEDNIDEERFIDLYTIMHLSNRAEGVIYRDRILKKVSTFFKILLKEIRNQGSNGFKSKIGELSKNMHEAKYTNLGYSQGGSGKAFGKEKFYELITSIKNSTAFSTNHINDILDTELYIKGIGVDLISDMITNLIYDILSEYTSSKVGKLLKNEYISEIDITYWDEIKCEWNKKKMPTILYYNSNKVPQNYLLTPFSYTCGSRQKEILLKKISDDYIFGIFELEIFGDPQKYKKYISIKKDNSRHVYKKDIVNMLNDTIGENTAVQNGRRITSKGLLDIVERYPEIKKYIESKIK